MKRHLAISLAALSLLAASGLVVTRSPASDAPAKTACAVVIVELDPGYSVSRTQERLSCS